MDTIERINLLLKEKQITPAKMAQDLGFSSGLFSQWKKRTQKPSTEKLQKIAEYLEVSVDFLLGREHHPLELSGIRSALYQETADLSDEILEKILEFTRFTKEQEKSKGNPVDNED